MSEEEWTEAEVWRTGARVGVLAGIVMALVATIASGARGDGFSTPLGFIGASFLGENARGRLGLSLVVGTVIHLLVATMFGLGYLMLVPARSRRALSALSGLGYGAAIYFTMTFLILSWAAPWAFQAINKGWSLVYHLAFGLTLGLLAPRKGARPSPARRLSWLRAREV